MNDEESQPPDENGATDDEQDNAREEDQMAWATQQVQRDFKATANKQNVPTDSGIIEEIQCINFMCHEHLTVTLGPLINFIIGHNGSGKSAVLTALQICLGGKATATNRAQNLKSLIKEGRERCSVQVRIKNQGPLAYKPRDYGKSIIVERHFSTTGASGFKIKDENNRVVSTKKTELEDILDAFSMQIDNPMNVLTQDMARQFLNHSTPKDKYKFFLQGTQLENLNRDYQQIENSLESMNSKAELKEADLGKLRKDMEELASRARRAENLERMRARETELAHQAAWAKVQEEEAEVAEAEAGLQEITDKIERRAAEAEEAAQTFERATATLEAAKESVTDITTQTEPSHQHVQELNEAWGQAKHRLLSLKADERAIVGEIKRKQESVNSFKREIEQHRQRQAEADNGLYAAKQTELADAKEAAEQAKQAYTTHTTGLAELQDNTRAAQSEKRNADQELEKAKSNEQHVKANIQSLQGNQRNWLDSYQNPAGLRKLLQAIEQDTRFREKPVGPVGRHITLVESEWGYILEKQFGAALNSFVVTSKADQTVLSELMRRNNW
jgi:chromosome segregation ATPase